MAAADLGTGAPQSRRQSWIDGPELAEAASTFRNAGRPAMHVPLSLLLRRSARSPIVPGGLLPGVRRIHGTSEFGPRSNASISSPTPCHGRVS
jgi:hypothetical protein